MANITDEQLQKDIVQSAMKRLIVCTDFKRPRLEKIKLYQDTYAGKQKPKLRIQYNVPLPILSGMVDSLCADFDEDIMVKFGENHPADYLKIKKLQAGFDREVHSLRPNARWNYKVRADKFLAIMTGVGITKTWGESDPKFSLNFDNVALEDFIFEPKGGGILENHMFVGEEGIFKTKEQLESGAESKLYIAKNVKEIVSAGASDEYRREMEGLYGDKLNRFRSMGLDADSNNYIGQQVHNLVQMQIVFRGERYYLLFDPWTQKAVRLELNKDVFESNLYIYTAWHTHSDPKNFLSKSYTDDFYPVHDFIGTSLNQELTNRNKKNMTPTAFDRDMFNAAELDSRYERPDKLIGVDTKGGTRRISEGLFEFKAGELTGTIDLISWLQKSFNSSTGVEELNNQANDKNTSAHVVYSSLQSASKRIGHKAKSYQECYAEVGLRSQKAFDEHLTEAIAVKLVGVEGYGWDWLTREDLKMNQSADAKVISAGEQDRENIIGKDQKLKWLTTVIPNQTLFSQYNPKVIAEMAARDIAGLKDDDITELMDVSAYGNKDIKAKADIAIMQLRKGKMPEIVWDATIKFIEIIFDHARSYKNQLIKDKTYNLFFDFLDKHYVIAAENMATIASQIQSKAAQLNTQPQDPNLPQEKPTQPQLQTQNVGAGSGIPQVQQTDMNFGGTQ
jgi:hypothetical protein